MEIGDKRVEDCSFEELLDSLRQKYLSVSHEALRLRLESGTIIGFDTEHGERNFGLDADSLRVGFDSSISEAFVISDEAEEAATTPTNQSLKALNIEASANTIKPFTSASTMDIAVSCSTEQTAKTVIMKASDSESSKGEDEENSSDGEDDLNMYISNLTTLQNLEQGEHRDSMAKKKIWYAASPSAPWVLTRKVLALLCIVYDLWVVPFMYTFECSIFTLNGVMLVFWTLHMMLSPFEGYMKQDGRVEIHLKKTFKNYIWTWMFFDLALVLRELVVVVFDDMTTNGVDILAALRLARVLQARQIIFTMKLFIQSGDLKSLLRCLELFSSFLLICHCFACGWYVVGMHYTRSRLTWTMVPISDFDSRTVVDRSLNSRYFYCYYWTLNQIGFGRSTIQPRNSVELAYSVFVCQVGVFSFITMVAGIMTVLSKFIYQRQAIWEAELKLRTYLKHHAVAPAMNARIWNVTRQLSSDKPTYQPENSVTLVQNLPEALLLELRMAIFLPTALAHPFFQAYVISTPWKKPLKELVGLGGVSEMSMDREAKLFEPGHLCESMFFVVAEALQYRKKEISSNTGLRPSVNTQNLRGSIRAVAHIMPKMWICEMALWVHWTNRGVCTSSRSSITHLVVVDAEVFGLTMVKHTPKSSHYGKRFLQIAKVQGFTSDLIEDDGGQLQAIAESVFLMTEFDVISCRPAYKSLYSWRNEWIPWNKKQWDKVWKSSMTLLHLDSRGALHDAMAKDFKYDIVLMYQTLFSDNLNTSFAPQMTAEEREAHDNKLLVLKRLLLCFAVCGLRMTTETNSSKTKPWPFPLASSLCHGQRVLVSLYGITAQEFLNVLTFGMPDGWNWEQDGVPSPYYTRWFATHALQLNTKKKKQPSPFIEELKLKTFGNIDQSFSSKHLGVDLPVGGVGNPLPSTDVNKRGTLHVGPAGVPYENPSKPLYLKDVQHGHLFVHWDNFVDPHYQEVAAVTPQISTSTSTKSGIRFGKEGVVGCVMLGIEGSAPGKKDFLGGAHGFDGVPHVQSAFGKCKWERYSATQHGVPTEYGGMRVNIDKRRLQQVMQLFEISQFCRCRSTEPMKHSPSNFQKLFRQRKIGKKSGSALEDQPFEDESDLFKAILQADDTEAEMLLTRHYDLERIPLQKIDEVVEEEPDWGGVLPI